VNIFNNLTIPNNYFYKLSFNIKYDLLFYLYDNLKNENNDILRWDLQIALKINANE
jgi:hypothetical protein